MCRLSLFFSVFLLTSCQAHERVMDVKSLQQVVANCDDSETATCLAKRKELERYEKLAMKLEAAPQAFGLSILQLQKKLVSAQQALKQAKQRGGAKQKWQKLEEKSTQLQQQYNEHLAVLRWLESPQ